MWLIETSTLTLHEFVGEDIPPYAILSHRWGPAQDELSQKDFRKGLKKETCGYAKIESFCEFSRVNQAQWAWVDTCCIDKRSSAELSEAINSMFLYYQNAEFCVAYLQDVDFGGDWSESEWWHRGWTLQELIAPTNLVFVNKRWETLGHKDELAQKIASTKKIPYSVLMNAKDNIMGFCVGERLSWAANRKTNRTEDAAYCLLGLFRISMPLLYGEGKQAFRRLQVEIIRKYPDDTIFAWSPTQAVEPPTCSTNAHDVLAEHPDSFRDFPSGNPMSDQPMLAEQVGNDHNVSSRLHPCAVTSWGIELRADADRLIPRKKFADEDGQRWAVTLTYVANGRLIELYLTLILVRSSSLKLSYQRTECQLGLWRGSHLDKKYKIQGTVKNKVFHLQYDPDMHYESPSSPQRLGLRRDLTKEPEVLPNGKVRVLFKGKIARCESTKRRESLIGPYLDNCVDLARKARKKLEKREAGKECLSPSSSFNVAIEFPRDGLHRTSLP